MSSRPHRALLLSDRYLPEVGGTITWFENVYRRYPKGTASIVTQGYPGDRAIDRDHEGIRIHRTNLKRYPFLKPESLLLFANLLRLCVWSRVRHGTDVVHAGKVFPEGYAANVFHRLTRTPYMVYAHGEDVLIFNSFTAYQGILPRVYNEAAAVVANSDFTREKLIEIGVHPENIVRISPGVDPGFFRPSPPDAALIERHGLAGKRVILSVGRLTRRKGHDHVLRALPAVLERHPDVVYVILSTGEEEARLRTLTAELSLTGHVRFVGEVPYRQLPDYFNLAELFVLANRTLPPGDVEGFGIVFVEANACGKAVVAGESGGTADPVRDGVNGFRVDASTPEAVAGVLGRALADPERLRAMGREGRRIAETEFDWNVVCRQIWQLSEDVAWRRFPCPKAAGSA